MGIGAAEAEGTSAFTPGGEGKAASHGQQGRGTRGGHRNLVTRGDGDGVADERRHLHVHPVEADRGGQAQTEGALIAGLPGSASAAAEIDRAIRPRAVVGATRLAAGDAASGNAGRRRHSPGARRRLRVHEHIMAGADRPQVAAIAARGDSFLRVADERPGRILDDTNGDTDADALTLDRWPRPGRSR